jgi:hypothetical protein
MEIIPIIPGVGGYVPESPAVVNFICGPNRWYWSVVQQGTVVQEQNGAYGEFTGQFAELSLLWATYRLDSVKLTFVPNNTGAGSQSSVVSAIPTAGETIPVSS